ncbi:MAG: hypothetical protein KME21_23890 [Desmonostoc vinosum HA7617-LM4]|jgi:hypothetical protein|nr:hypothetical protein [Desmonostoc vinosum HA7617-LM4]
MLMRIWTATVVLSSSWLISGVIASEPLNSSSSLVQKPTIYSQSTIAKPVIVSEAEFGIKRVDSEGQTILVETNKIPLIEGNAYGWRIKLRDYQGEVKWREVLRLPKRPETWSTDNGENFSISTDGTTAETKRTQSAPNGVIENFWTIAPGDPAGQYKIEVFIDDRLISSFNFETIIVEQNRM